MLPFVTVVSGLPRSGNSLMMQMLAAGGIPSLADGANVERHRAADADNPRGYLELQAVKRTRTDTSWLTYAPGKAVKVIHFLLPQLPAHGYTYRVVFMHRAMVEVLASQRAMLARGGKAGAKLSDSALARVFCSQVDRAKAWAGATASAELMDVDCNVLLADPASVTRAISEFLTPPRPTGAFSSVQREAMAACVDRSLYRQRAVELH